MEEPNELHALDKIATEVDEAQIKVILASQCIKAQAYLVEKLKQQANKYQETCSFLSSANLKLQFEISQAEQNIISLRTAKEKITMANVQLKTEWLIAKENKMDLIERVERGEKKYEAMWLEAKERFESIPRVRKLLEATAKAGELKEKIINGERETEALHKEIKAKKEACQILDQKRIVQLAEFMLRERPKMIKEINEKSKAIADLTIELKSLSIHTNTEAKVLEKQEPVAAEDTAAVRKMDNDDINQLMPKLRWESLELDDISIKLDQAKMKRVDYNLGLAKKESFAKSYFDLAANNIFNRRNDTEEFISYYVYFPKPSAKNEEDKMQSYSKKKLINILEDVEIDARVAMNLLSDVDPDKLQPVETIVAECKYVEEQDATKHVVAPQESAVVEEIPTLSNAEDIVMPPTPFLDGSLKAQDSQGQKKSVTFALACSSEAATVDSNGDRYVDDTENKTEALNNQLDISGASDDGFTRIKDMVMKKHNIDLSPEFVYGKNIMANKATVQTKTDEKIVTSKFFEYNENEIAKESPTKDKTGEKRTLKETEKPQVEETVKSVIFKDKASRVDDDDELMVSSPKKRKIEELKPEETFDDFALNYMQGLPKSLDVSIGFDEGDFLHCIDSSLLLSPKADIPMNTEKDDMQSQETPSFFSGMRKTGLSFFGTVTKDTQPASSAPIQGSSSFNFKFGGEEKKNRGGLFSMFK